MNGVKHGRRVDSVIGRLFQEGFASAGDKLGDGRFGNLTVEGVGDGAKSWQEHTTLRIWATVQAIFNADAVAVGTDEVSSGHVSTSKEIKSPDSRSNRGRVNGWAIKTRQKSRCSHRFRKFVQCER